MNATHTKNHPRSHFRTVENSMPEVTMWGGPKATHIYIHIPNVSKEQIQVKYPEPYAVGTMNMPAGSNDLIRIVLPKHVT